MKTYKIVLRLGDYFESRVIEMEAENWEEICNKIFGGLEIVDTKEDLITII